MFPKFFSPIEVLSVHELGLGAIFAILFWPIAFLIYCLNITLRFFSQLACNYYYPGRYTIADGEDSAFGVKLHGSSKSYIHGYKIIRGTPDINLIRSKVLQVFTKTDGFDKLKHVMTYKFGYFCWDTKVAFDVTQNIRLLDDFDPEEIVDEIKLSDICSRFVGKDYEVDKPQWEILMIPKYRMPGEPLDSEKTSHYALIVRLHHAYCDGISWVLFVNNFLSDQPGELPIDPTKGFKNPIWIKAYIWAKILVVGPMNFFRTLAVLIFYPSLYCVERYLKSKVLARSSPIEMETLKRIRIASGTSVTSITLSAVYAALHKTHLRVFPGRPVPEKLHLASIGVMLPYCEEKRLVNQFTMWRYSSLLKMEDPNPKIRLARTNEQVRECASQPDPVFNFYMQRALGSLPKFLHEILFSLSGTPIMLSNVPGYTTPVKVFGGEIVDVTAWIPLVTTTGIGLSTQSYCGRMRFSAVTDPQVFANADELRVFLEDIVNEIHVLAKAYGVHDVNENAQKCAIIQQKKETEGQSNEIVQIQKGEVMKDVNDNEQASAAALTIRSSPQTTPVWLSSPSTANIEVIPLQCRSRKKDHHHHHHHHRIDGKNDINACIDVRRGISI